MNGEAVGVHSTMARNPGCRSVLTGAIGGLVIGLLISYYAKQYFVRCGFPDLSICCKVISLSPPGQEESPATSSAEGALADSRPRDTFVFVGIMTAKKFIDTRGLNAYRTWVNSINGKVMFFSSEGSVSNFGVPVVALPGVDDSYPPQKKSFMMLKYMHDHFIDKYEWFVRADDDVFIKGDRLEKFLRSVNSSKPQFIGQAGVGKPEELGLLSLTASENFCMGGPGMIFSRETLRRMAPHVGECLNNLYTSHEDVEIGRCVRKFAGIQCTWAYEMQQILYQNYKEDKGSFKTTLKSKEVINAVSLHPVKEPVYQFRIYNYLQFLRIMEGKQRQLRLHREMALMDKLVGSPQTASSSKLGLQPSLNKYLPRSQEEVLEWEFLMKPLFSHRNQNPKRGMEGSLSAALDDVIMQIMTIVNRNARQRGRTIDFKEILYGYRRLDPLHGADYILDLLLIYRKHKGRKMTVPVRRHAYLQQTFLETEFMEEVPYYTPQPGIGAKVAQLFLQMAGQQEGEGGPRRDKRTETIHFVMPLAGRLHIFRRFMANYEEVVLAPREAAVLHVVLYDSRREPEALPQILEVLDFYRSRYGAAAIRVVRAAGDFVRGRGLELGAAECGSDALLFMVDVDIVMQRSCLNRIRLNVRQGQQVYFPIVFSQYDPEMVCVNQSPHCKCEGNSSACLIHPWDFSEATGYWRQFGFGIAAMYRSDMQHVGGFDLSIEGWGKEDVDLYTKFIESNVTVFRAIDPGMTHAFHPITSCDSRLEPAQFQMCVGSKAASYASETQLANMVYSISDIMHRHETFHETFHVQKEDDGL